MLNLIHYKQNKRQLGFSFSCLCSWNQIYLFSTFLIPLNILFLTRPSNHISVETEGNDRRLVYFVLIVLVATASLQHNARSSFHCRLNRRLYSTVTKMVLGLGGDLLWPKKVWGQTDAEVCWNLWIKCLFCIIELFLPFAPIICHVCKHSYATIRNFATET